jgi:uncharacterized membrane protein
MATSRLDPRPQLETPEECHRSEERDQALTSRAKRLREEVAADRDRFELTRDKIVFGLELALALAMLLVAVIVIALNPELAPFVLLGGSGIGGVTAAVKRRP